MAVARPNRRRLLRIVVGYLFLGVAAFALGLWLFFPYDALARRIESAAAERGALVRIGTLRPVGFPAVEAESISVDAVGTTPLALLLGPTRVDLSLSDLFGGRLHVNVRSESFGGLLTASIPLEGGRVAVAWRGLNLGKIAEASDLIPLPLDGATTGTAEVETPVGSLSRFTGKIDADIASAALGPGSVIGMPVARLALGSGAVKAEAQEGRVEMEEVRLTGGEMDVEWAGSMRMGPSLPRSSLTGTLTLHPTPAVEAQYPIVFAALSQYKRSGGDYTLRVEGNFSAPRVRAP